MREIGNVKTILELVIVIGTAIGFIWHISEIKNKIYNAMDEIKDNSMARDNDLKNRLEVHLNDYNNRQEMINYMVNGLNEKLDHKYNRLYSSMRDVEKYLQKTQNFRVREYFGDDSSAK